MEEGSGKVIVFKITELNHVGVAVLNLSETTEMFGSKFGLKVSDRIESKDQGLSVALVQVGNSMVELMEPLERTGAVAKFLEKQGRNFLHHIAFSVDSELDKVSSQLKDLGVSMTYPTARIGVIGEPINFCHPKFTSNILIELCQTSDKSPDA